jgi:hypothetical protein
MTLFACFVSFSVWFFNPETHPCGLWTPKNHIPDCPGGQCKPQVIPQFLHPLGCEFDICSVAWGSRAWLLSTWVILEADWVIVNAYHRKSDAFHESCLIQSSFMWVSFSERISQVLHIQSKRWGMAKAMTLFSLPWLLLMVSPFPTTCRPVVGKLYCRSPACFTNKVLLKPRHTHLVMFCLLGLSPCSSSVG